MGAQNLGQLQYLIFRCDHPYYNWTGLSPLNFGDLTLTGVLRMTSPLVDIKKG